MRLIYTLSLLLALAVTGCSRSPAPVPPVTEETPTHGIQTYRFAIQTDGLSKTDVLATVAAFAGQHSLPSRGRTMAKDWPAETYGFGYLPCYTNVHIAVGFGGTSPQTMIELMYYGTNDSFYEGYHIAVRDLIESNFAGRLVSVRTNWQ